MKFCKDCRWYASADEVRKRQSPYGNYNIVPHAMCDRVLSDERDMVTGEHTHRVSRPCRTERNDAGACGPDAKHFESNGRGELSSAAGKILAEFHGGF